MAAPLIASRVSMCEGPLPLCEGVDVEWAALISHLARAERRTQVVTVLQLDTDYVHGPAT